MAEEGGFTVTNESPAERTKTRDSNLYGMLCHLLALSWTVGIPFGWLLGPLVMWLAKRDEYPFVDDQGKESLNFQLSNTLYALTIVLIPFLIVYDIIFVIIASVHASEGKAYRYPLTIRFIK